MSNSPDAPGGVSPWDVPAPPGAFALEESARRIGHYAWVARRSFEVLGACAAKVDEPWATSCLESHSQHHAWHAELWWERLPALREMDRAERCVPPNDDLAAFFDELEVAPPDDATVATMVGVYRVLMPHLVAVLSMHGAHTSPASDAPVVRTLGLVLGDLQRDWREGDRLLQWSISTPERVDDAVTRQAALATMLVASGGICGPGTFEVPRMS